MKAAALLSMLAVPALAQNSDGEGLGRYDSCLIAANAAFEAALDDSMSRASDPNFDMVGGGAFDFCAVLEIGDCDGTNDRFACQAVLTDVMVALRGDIWAEIPAPQDVAGLDPIWSDGLYPSLWAVVQGVSAGPDCAGATQAYTVWCEARAASRSLSDVITLRQVARVLGVVPALDLEGLQAERVRE